VIALSAALDMWGLIELDKLAHFAMGAPPIFAGLAETGEKAAERFKAVAERWKVDDKEMKKLENIIKEIINAPLRGETSQSGRGRMWRFRSWRSRGICLRPSRS
jgi:hypothetical protein